MYKNGFGINNLQWLMCHKTKPNQTKPIIILLSAINLTLFYYPPSIQHYSTIHHKPNTILLATISQIFIFIQILKLKKK